MALTQDQLSEMVWAEISCLTVVQQGAPSPPPTPPDGDMTYSLLVANIAYLCVLTNGDYFDSASLPTKPGDEQNRSNFMQKVIATWSQSSGETYAGKPLYQRVALLAVGGNGQLLAPDQGLPDSLRGALDPTANVIGTFAVVNHAHGANQTYRLVSPANSKASDSPIFVSMLTGTSPCAQTPVSLSRRITGWAIAVFGVIAFALVIANLYGTGRLLADGNTIMAKQRFGYDKLLNAEYANVAIAPPLPSAPPADDKACLPDISGLTPDEIARMTHESAPAVDGTRYHAEACLYLWQAALRVAWAQRTPELNAELHDQGEPVVDVHWWGGLPIRVDGVRLLGDPMAAAEISLVCPMVLLMISMLSIAAGVGLASSGIVFGILIDGRNRLSLSRMQVFCWTILVLPMILGFACFNSGFNAIALAHLAGNSSSKLELFPTVPGAIWLAMGISIVSALASPAILQLAGSASRPVNDDISVFQDPSSTLDRNAGPADASLSDLFLGEQWDNSSQIDISRLQMVVITIGLLVSYGSLLFALAASIDLKAVFTALLSQQSLFTTLPPAGATFVAMLAVSHGAYLVTKVANTQQAANSAANTSSST